MNMVAFTEIGFLFRFLPAFLAVYYITPPKYRNTTLLFGSIVFYALGDPYFVLLLLGAVWVNYVVAKNIFACMQAQDAEKPKRIWLIAVLVMDAGLLAAFKLLGAFLGSSLLPLGLSFYLFKMISFQMDIYRGEIKNMPTLKRTAVYFTMFPQIVSGPIMRFNEGSFVLEEKEFAWEKVEEGLQYFILGLGMKVLLADRLAIMWKDIHVIGYESISTPLAWLGAVAYSLELYFDFWGYSLMASGLCVILGFPFIKNFEHPYASKSIGEFWRRWHMTLGSFFKDYVYIPLGGSRVKTGRMIRNLLVVWLLTGFWHGGSWNFILWGLLLFALIVLEKLWLGKILQKYSWMGNVGVLLFIPITWVFFAITDMKELGLYLGRMFPFAGKGIAVNHGDVWKYMQLYWGYLAVGIIWCVPAVYRFWEKHRKHVVSVILTVVVFWWSVYSVVSMGNNPFAYLKF